MERAVLAWSGGKDAALALDALEGSSVRVEELLTTVSAETQRSRMHGVHRDCYEIQAAALGLPVNIVELPVHPSNDTYNAAMKEELQRYAEDGFERVVFGDLYLGDVREYRENLLSPLPIEGLWPLWGDDPDEVMERFLDAGFEAIVVAVLDDVLPEVTVGTTFDQEFLATLPSRIDPAGESGAFHTFVVNGPLFDRPIPIEPGRTVREIVGEETSITYCELTNEPSG